MMSSRYTESLLLLLSCILTLSLLACDDTDETTEVMAGSSTAGAEVNPVAGMPMAGVPTAGVPTAGVPTAGVPMAGMPMAGVPMAGMPMAGMPIAGMPMAGMPMAGTPMAGMPMAGMSMAGTPMAGMPMAGTTEDVDCSAATPAQPCVVSVYGARQDDVTPDLTPVQVEGVVTSVRINTDGAASHITIQDPAGGEYSGIWVYLNNNELGALPIFNRGEAVRIVGVVDNFYNQRQINTVTQVDLLGPGSVIAPLVISAIDASTSSARAAALEGVLVQVSSVTVQEVNPSAGPGDSDPNNEFVIDGGLRVDDYIHAYELPMVGDSFSSITGVLRFGNDDSKLNPRDAADLAR